MQMFVPHTEEDIGDLIDLTANCSTLGSSGSPVVQYRAHDAAEFYANLGVVTIQYTCTNSSDHTVSLLTNLIACH